MESYYKLSGSGKTLSNINVGLLEALTMITYFLMFKANVKMSGQFQTITYSLQISAEGQVGFCNEKRQITHTLKKLEINAFA